MVQIVINPIYRNSGESDENYELRKKEVVSRVLKKFKKIIDKSGIIKEVQEKRYYTKPSEARRLAKKKGKNEWRKKERKLNESIDRRDKR